MIRYILDTNICIELIRNRPADLVTRIASLDSSRTVLSSITLAELNVGVAKSRHRVRNWLTLLLSFRFQSVAAGMTYSYISARFSV